MRRDDYEPDNQASSEDKADHTAPSGQVASGSATQTLSDRSADVQEQASEVAGRAEEQAGTLAEKAQEQATAVKDKAVEQAEVGKQKAASGLHSAAEQLRNRSGEDVEGGVKAQVVTKAADTIDQTATYLDEHEASEIWSDLERFVKEHPLKAAAGALVAGFVFGRIVR